ncbi:unnamed protein product [Lactuca saligna]|uniref:Uncharacterized protein n=1 Tax=Lactuca saligna TaxID=75948 RepID=A0AA35YVK8_LACSI|nr:unnamed protein product [Lactuca saligna]
MIPYIPFYIVGTCSSCVLLHRELDEACQSIAYAKDIISITIGKKSKLFDWLLIFRDQYISAEVNMRSGEGMKLVGEELLFKVGKLHGELIDHCRIASE